MEDKLLGELIKEARHQKKLSQQDLANKLNVTRQAVSNWENNISYPDQSISVKLCKLLDINIKDIYGDKIEKDFNRLIEQERFKKKVMFIGWVIFIVAISFISLLVINKRNTSFYLVDIDTDYFTLENSYYVYSNKDNYFNLGKITSPIFNLYNSKIKIYYLDNLSKKEIYSTKYNDNILIKLDNDLSIIKNINNMYMEINYNYRNTFYTDNFKLNFNKKFNSKGLIGEKNDKDNKKVIDYKLDVDTLMENNYEYNPYENGYVKYNKYNYIYYNDDNIFKISGKVENERFYALKDYNKNYIRIGLEKVNDRFVTIYMKDSIIKYNNDVKFDYEKYLNILNEELAKLESN